MREASQLFANDPGFFSTLGHMLLACENVPGAIAAYRKALQIDPFDELTRPVLAGALRLAGDRAGEIAELRADIRLRSAQEKQGREVSIHSGSKDQSPWLSLHRADGLFEHEQFQIVSLVLDTVAEHGGARDDEMGDGNAYPLSVINDTYLESRFVESFSFIWGHLENGLDLGAALAECGDLAEAVTAYSEAIRLGVNDQATAAAHDSIGNVRRLLGDPPAAIDAFREAIRLNPDEPHEARYNLSVALAQSDDAVGAITALREAVQRQQPPQAGSFRLLRAIVMSPRPKDAVEALKRVRDDAHDDGTVRKAIEVSLSQFAQLSKLGVPIPRVFRLSPQRNNYPAHCYSLRLFAASAAIWAAGFAADPTLAEDMEAQNRYLAASAAALAAAGKGIDQPPLDELAQSRWRKQALDWLSADLAYWSKQAETGVPQSVAFVRKTLQSWRIDRDFASVRDESHLKRLPQDEQKAWQAFWSRVAAILKNANQY